MVTETPPSEVSTNPLVTVKEAGFDGPRLLPKMVTMSPGLTGPLAKLAALTMPKTEAVFPTVTGIVVSELPPGAGFATSTLSVAADVKKFAGTTACNTVELSLKMVVANGVEIPWIIATVAV